MNKTKSKTKSAPLGTRVSPVLNEVIDHMADREDLTKSEWVNCIKMGNLL